MLLNIGNNVSLAWIRTHNTWSDNPRSYRSGYRKCRLQKWPKNEFVKVRMFTDACYLNSNDSIMFVFCRQQIQQFLPRSQSCNLQLRFSNQQQHSEDQNVKPFFTCNKSAADDFVKYRKNMYNYEGIIID